MTVTQGNLIVQSFEVGYFWKSLCKGNEGKGDWVAAGCQVPRMRGRVLLIKKKNVINQVREAKRFAWIFFLSRGNEKTWIPFISCRKIHGILVLVELATLDRKKQKTNHFWCLWSKPGKHLPFQDGLKAEGIDKDVWLHRQMKPAPYLTQYDLSEFENIGAIGLELWQVTWL